MNEDWARGLRILRSAGSLGMLAAFAFPLIVVSEGCGGWTRMTEAKTVATNPVYRSAYSIPTTEPEYCPKCGRYFHNPTIVLYADCNGPPSCSEPDLRGPVRSVGPMDWPKARWWTIGAALGPLLLLVCHVRRRPLGVKAAAWDGLVSAVLIALSGGGLRLALESAKPVPGDLSIDLGGQGAWMWLISGAFLLLLSALHLLTEAVTALRRRRQSST